MAIRKFVEHAALMENGRVILPKSVLEVLGVSEGGRITFVVEDKTVRMVHSAVYAMDTFQEGMAGEAARVGLASEEAVMALVEEVRKN